MRILILALDNPVKDLEAQQPQREVRGWIHGWPKPRNRVFPSWHS